MDTLIFIGLVTVALVDAIKDVFPNVHGKVTVLIAGLVGGALAALAGELGLASVAIAEGIAAGLASAGTVGVAKRVSKG